MTVCLASTTITFFKTKLISLGWYSLWDGIHVYIHVHVHVHVFRIIICATKDVDIVARGGGGLSEGEWKCCSEVHVCTCM